MNVISDLPDYYLHLQFNIITKDETTTILKKLVEYTRQSYLILGYIFDFILKFISK